MLPYSSKRPRPRGLSAIVTGDQNNSSQTTVNNEIQRCSYTGCYKPAYSDSRRSGRKFCGVMHSDFFMNNLVSPRVLSKANGDHPKCMFPECNRTARKDEDSGQHFDFCGKRHMLAMVEELTKLWSREGRLCRLPECLRHVYVEDDGTCRDYCGTKHAILAAKQKGAGKIAEDKNWRTTEDSLIYGERGYHQKLSDPVLERLLTNGCYSECSKLVVSGVNIYQYHPWELVTVSTQQDHKGLKQRKTKEGFSWKRSSGSRAAANQVVLQTTYFVYIMLETRSEDLSVPHVKVYADYNQKKPRAGPRGDSTRNRSSKPGSRWRMREITLCDSQASKKIIVMILQDKSGEPVWPPSMPVDFPEEKKEIVDQTGLEAPATPVPAPVWTNILDPLSSDCGAGKIVDFPEERNEVVDQTGLEARATPAPAPVWTNILPDSRSSDWGAVMIDDMINMKYIGGITSDNCLSTEAFDCYPDLNEWEDQIPMGLWGGEEAQHPTKSTSFGPFDT